MIRPSPALLLLLPIPLLALAAPSAPLPVVPDDGMWTFDNAPLKRLKEVYGFEPSKEWLEHVQKASVRFNSGGSGSFVSPHGLVMTNHHVGAGDLQKVSSAKKDYLKDGFLARTQDEEIKCPDLELNVLMSLEDVTSKIQGAVKAGADDKEAAKARRAAIAQLTKEESEKTGLRCDVVTLYQGAEYALYRYKKYTDIRIVCAPEKQAAFYGGDPDNFTYPRYDLDFTFFRVYENGKPIQSPSHLKWSAAGPTENELVFVSGHPGSTGRLDTVAKCEFLRDVAYPERLRILSRDIATLRSYAAKGPEQARQAEEEIFGLENSKKAISGYLDGLRTKAVWDKKVAMEEQIRKVAEPAELAALDTIAKVRGAQKSWVKGALYGGLNGDLTGIAVRIVQLVKEVQKPNGERLAPYQDAALESTKFSLFSPAPTYPAMDEMMLSAGLADSLAQLGKDHEFVKLALGTRTPGEVATEAIRNTRIADVEVRKQLVQGGVAAVEKSDDPLLQLAWRVEPYIRAMNKRGEDEVLAPEASAMEKIARARFRAFGKSVAPDATFTLRLSYGACKSYELGTTLVPWKTTFYGLYERSAATDNKSPFDLPARFVERKGKLDLATPLNFVCTCDIIGGNSGSPVINKNAEVVGLIFDGNIQSLGNRFVFDEEVARAVAVHSSGIVEALSKLYDAHDLVAELTGKAKAQDASSR